MTDGADSVKSELTTVEKQPNAAAMKTAWVDRKRCVGMLSNAYVS